MNAPARRSLLTRFLPAAFALLAGACDPAPGPTGAAPTASGASGAAAPKEAATPSAAPAPAPAPPVSREGQALARSPISPVLYVADEDHRALRRVPLTDALLRPPPIADPPAVARVDAGEAVIPLPGRPAQIVALADRVLCTVRDPGLLLVLDAADPTKELARVPVPADAWGLAVSPDLATAYVTSAWTHRLTAVDLAAARVRWSVDTAREPRGLAASPDGKAVYVSHLVGAPLTVVDVTDVAREPRPTRLAFPPDPLRTRFNEALGASLGYAALLSPDGRRLYVARHALGASSAWQGSPTVDVLSTVTGAPIAAPRKAPPFGTLTTEEYQQNFWSADEAGFRVGTSTDPMVQPRAIAYRRKTHHLLVASEGLAQLVELDALAIAPALQKNRLYHLGGLAPEKPTEIQIPPHCGAPTGVVLSPDEDVALVYCRSTDNLVAVRLTPDGVRELRDETSYVENATWKRRESPWGPFAYAKLAAPADPEDLALGRRLFYDANEPIVSGGMGCAGCHPEGRDDGHTWRELKKYESDKLPTFIAGPSIAPSDDRRDGIRYGVARQTPMLAGRVDAVGPYGWHAESPDLVHRIKAGFSLHRWWANPADGLTLRRRAEPIAAFLRKGLVPPPREGRELTPLTPEQARGQEIFLSAKAQCATCHTPKTGYTDRSANLPLRGFKALRFFDEDPNRAYKVPSLLFVGGTPPYYHDGSVETLTDLVFKNADRMGRTSHLSDEELRALVAFLETL